MMETTLKNTLQSYEVCVNVWDWTGVITSKQSIWKAILISRSCIRLTVGLSTIEHKSVWCESWISRVSPHSRIKRKRAALWDRLKSLSQACDHSFSQFPVSGGVQTVSPTGPKTILVWVADQKWQIYLFIYFLTLRNFTYCKSQ